MSTATPPALNSLRDIHLPKAVSIWPLAPGWYIVIALIVAALMLGLLFYLRSWYRNRAKKQAIHKLKELKALYKQGKNQQQIIAQVSILLRRVALAYFPKQNIAGLQGERWLQFLARNSQVQNFSREAKILNTAPYQAKIASDLNYLFPLVEQWINER